MATLSAMRWIGCAMVLVGLMTGCKHPEALPSERVYLAAIAPAHERSLGPMPTHVPEPDRGPENLPDHSPTHGPEHGPEGQPENVPPDQMPTKPGEGPRPDGDPNDGLAFKPKVAARQAPKVLGRVGPDDLLTAAAVWTRVMKWAPSAPAFQVRVGDEWIAYHKNGNYVRWQGEMPVRNGMGWIGESCFVREGRIPYPCTAEERSRVQQEAFLARVLYGRELVEQTNVDVRTHTELVISSKETQHMVIARVDEKTGRLQSLVSGEHRLFENLTALKWGPSPQPMLWEALESVAHGATERTESVPFWGLCADLTGPLTGVAEKVETLKTRAESRGTEWDERVGVLVQRQPEEGWRVCVPLAEEVDGASRFRAKKVGRIWHQGTVDTVLQQEDALGAWLERNELQAVAKAALRIRLFEAKRLGTGQEPLCALEIGLAP